MKSPTLFAALAVIGLSMGAITIPTTEAANRNEVGSVPTQRIDVTEFDLSTMADAQALYDHIRRGARQVCRPYRQPRVFWAMRHYRKCIETAVNDTVDAVDHVNLTAIHENGGPEVADR